MSPTQHSFDLPDGTKCSLYAITGEVLSESLREVTHVHQGSALVLPQTSGGAMVIPRQVQSTIQQRQSIWLRNDDGAEQQCSLDSVAPLPTRPGHQMTVVYANSDQAEGSMWLAAAANHKTREFKVADGKALFETVVPRPMARYSGSWLWWALFATALVGCLIGYLMGESANRARNGAYETQRMASCEAPQMWWTKRNHDERKVCLERQRSPDFQRQVQSSWTRAADADKTVNQAITLLIASMLLGVGALVGMGMRRASFRGELQREFIDRLQKTASKAVTAAHPATATA